MTWLGSTHESQMLHILLAVKANQVRLGSSQSLEGHEFERASLRMPRIFSRRPGDALRDISLSSHIPKLVRFP